MPTVEFTRNLQRHVDAPPANVTGSTVREVLDAVFVDNPRLRGYVLDERGALRKHMMIFVNNEQIQDRINLSDGVSADASIHVLQALSGG